MKTFTTNIINHIRSTIWCPMKELSLQYTRWRTNQTELGYNLTSHTQLNSDESIWNFISQFHIMQIGEFSTPRQTIEKSTTGWGSPTNKYTHQFTVNKQIQPHNRCVSGRQTRQIWVRTKRLHIQKFTAPSAVQVSAAALTKDWFIQIYDLKS